MVDLREEPHGFINQDAVTFYYGPLTLKKNQPSAVILADDQQRMRFAQACNYVLVNHITKHDGMPATKKPNIIALKSAATEQEIAAKLGVQYIRISVTDHFRPDHNDVNEFINFVNSLDEDAWVHVKCRGGRGRTTTFMVMYDMLKNPQLTKDDFFKRQVLIHGVNFLKMSVAKGHEWKSALAAGRLQFLNCFYEYLHAPDGYVKYMEGSKENHYKWSDWVRIHYPGLVDETYESVIE